MFLKLSHQRLDVYDCCKELVCKCYMVSTHFPSDERFGLTSQLKRAAMSVLLNLAEGCSRKSEKERRRFLEIARGSLVEADTALEIAVQLGFIKENLLEPLADLMVRTMSMISRMIKPSSVNDLT